MEGDDTNLVLKLTTAVAANAASGGEASTAVARHIWRRRPHRWREFFDRYSQAEEQDELSDSETVGLDEDWDEVLDDQLSEDEEDVEEIVETPPEKFDHQALYETFVETLHDDEDHRETASDVATLLDEIIQRDEPRYVKCYFCQAPTFRPADKAEEPRFRCITCMIKRTGHQYCVDRRCAKCLKIAQEAKARQDAEYEFNPKRLLCQNCSLNPVQDLDELCEDCFRLKCGNCDDFKADVGEELCNKCQEELVQSRFKCQVCGNPSKHEQCHDCYQKFSEYRQQASETLNSTRLSLPGNQCQRCNEELNDYEELLCVDCGEGHEDCTDPNCQQCLIIAHEISQNMTLHGSPSVTPIKERRSPSKRALTPTTRKKLVLRSRSRHPEDDTDADDEATFIGGPVSTMPVLRQRSVPNSPVKRHEPVFKLRVGSVPNSPVKMTSDVYKRLALRTETLRRVSSLQTNSFDDEPRFVMTSSPRRRLRN